MLDPPRVVIRDMVSSSAAPQHSPSILARGAALPCCTAESSPCGRGQISMVCELNDKEAAALNVKSFMKSFGREVTYEKLARERGGALLHPSATNLGMARAHALALTQSLPFPPSPGADAGSSTVVISIDRLATLLHICATFRGGKYKQKVTNL